MVNYETNLVLLFMLICITIHAQDDFLVKYRSFRIHITYDDFDGDDADENKQIIDELGTIF